MSVTISPEFAARLARRKPDDLIRAILLLETRHASESRNRQDLRSRRKAMTEAARRSTEAARQDIAQIVAEYGGSCLENGNLGVLGGVPVETTPEGIKALARLPRVRAVLEDQAVSLIDK